MIMFVYILKQFCDIHKVEFRFRCTRHIIPDCFRGLCRLGKVHISRLRIQAAPKTWKIAHKPQLLYATLRYNTFFFSQTFSLILHSTTEFFSSSSNRFIEPDVSTRKLQCGPSSGIQNGAVKLVHWCHWSAPEQHASSDVREPTSLHQAARPSFLNRPIYSLFFMLLCVGVATHQPDKEKRKWNIASWDNVWSVS